MKKAFFAISLLGMAMAAHAVTLSESFDDLGAGGDQDDLSALVGRGWYEQNNSTNAAVFGPYANGVSDTFASHSGAGYVSSNYMVGDGTISAWLVTPEVTLRNGSTFSFWTRTPSGSTYQDSLELRLSTSGSSTNVGSTATSVGDFSTLLTAVNPSLNGNYPTGWTQYTVTVNSLAPNVNVQGRFGFRYYVTNAGITGVNGNYIGIDDVAYTQVVPEPASLAALGLGAMALLRRRRRAEGADDTAHPEARSGVGFFVDRGSWIVDRGSWRGDGFLGESPLDLFSGTIRDLRPTIYSQFGFTQSARSRLARRK